jgi:hypothetical protein
VLEEGGWSTPRPGRFTSGKETRNPLYRRLGGPLGPAWTGVINLAPTGIRFPDCPTHNESPYQLRYPGSQNKNAYGNNYAAFTLIIACKFSWLFQLIWVKSNELYYTRR